eukprot:12906071-Prorocentrum_lima.AAC.1
MSWQGNVLIRHCSKVRRSLVYLTYLVTDVFVNHLEDAHSHVMEYLDNMPKATEYYGLVFRDNTW